MIQVLEICGIRARILIPEELVGDCALLQIRRCCGEKCQHRSLSNLHFTFTVFYVSTTTFISYISTMAFKLEMTIFVAHNY